jgi:outer membrane receptor protein involved in Fe transport
VTDHWTVQSNLYYRRFDQQHRSTSAALPSTALCLENDRFPASFPQAGFQILNQNTPGIPRHQVKGGVDYWVTPELKLGTDVIWVSSQWFVGDDANQNPKLADYWVANLHGSYQLTKEWQIYGFINNLFNRKFATFGTFFDPQSRVALAIPNVLFDHRMVTPAQPLSVYVGMRAKL